MSTFSLTLEYLGTHFAGFQKQPHARTVQGVLEETLEKLVGVEVSVVGAGRTDAGVHARGQVVGVRAPWRWEPGDLRRALNALLPEDIAVKEAREASADFHARRDARFREYAYQILNRPYPSPFLAPVSHFCQGELDLQALQAGSRLLVGEQDFRAFTTAEAEGKGSTVRRLTHIFWIREGDLLVMRIRANGFLHHMVRLMAGTLLEVGVGRRRPEVMGEILASGDRSRAGTKAPAKGLVLERVEYDESG